VEKNDSKPGAAFRLAWSVLLLISLALVTLGVLVFYLPVEPSDFASITGQRWADFEAANPEVAVFIERGGLLMGVAIIGVGLFSLFLTWYGIRDKSRLAIQTMWTLPVVLVGATLAFVLGDWLLPTIVSAGAAGLASLMLLLARNRIE
jgi:hypothetical protein